VLQVPGPPAPPYLNPTPAKVTCYSSIKLAHEASGHRLHSHKIAYSRGSRQQSVTALPDADDGTSYWTVVGSKVGGGGGGGWRQGGGERRDGPRGANRPVVSAPTPPSPSVQDEPCAPGQPLKKQQRLRLQHASSRKWLHSHLYQSPLSGNQEVRSPGAFIGAAGRAARSEPAPLQARHWAAPINPHAPSRRQVSAFGSDSASDGGDVWTVDWDDRRAGEFWKQDVRVRGGRAEGAQGVGKGGGLQRAPPSQHGRPGARGSAGLAPDAPTRRRAAPTGDPAPRRDRRLPPLPAPRDVRPPTSWAA
jgi:hypothetical protein